MTTTSIVLVIEEWCAKHARSIALEDLANVLARQLNEQVGMADLRNKLNDMIQGGMIKETTPGMYTL